jgi:hypothetical protein
MIEFSPNTRSFDEDHYFISNNKISCSDCMLDICYKCNSPIATTYYKVYVKTQKLYSSGFGSVIEKKSNILVCDHCVSKCIHLVNDSNKVTNSNKVIDSKELQGLFRS